MISGHIVFNHASVRPYVPVEITSTLKKETRPYIGWIDTGATNTVISKKVADDLKLFEEGEAKTTLADGTETKSRVFLIKFKICGTTDDSVFTDSVNVTLSNQDFKGYDLLIGLDILQHAKFCYNGVTQTYTLSFKKE